MPSISTTALYLLGAMLTAAIAATEPPSTAAEFDDPVVSFSQYDDIQQMLNDGVNLDHAELVFQRVTMGAKGLDPTYDLRKHQFDRLMVLWGAYHFARTDADPENTPAAQADHFLSTILSQGLPSGGRVLLVVDWLPYGPKGSKAMSPAGFCALIEDIHNRTGTYPGVATSLPFLKELVEKGALDAASSQTLAKCWLWITSWAETPPDLPAAGPWKEWTFWMHDSVDNPSRQTLRKNSILSPDLSKSSIPRGKELKAWWEKHAWNGVLQKKV